MGDKPGPRSPKQLAALERTHEKLKALGWPQLVKGRHSIRKWSKKRRAEIGETHKEAYRKMPEEKKRERAIHESITTIRKNLAASQSPLILLKSHSCRRILIEHHEILKDDPEHLTTEFLADLIGCACQRPTLAPSS